MYVTVFYYIMLPNHSLLVLNALNIEIFHSEAVT